MTANPPLLCLSRSLWDEERAGHRNRYQMLTRFARERPVLLLECPFELASLARPRRAKLEALRAALAGPRRQPEGIATLRPLAWWLRDGDARAWRLNLALYRPWLRRATRLLGAPPIVWLYDHRLWPLLDRLPRRIVAYHCTEDYAGIAGRAHGPATAAWVAAQERALLDRVDLVFAVSEGLAAPRRRASPALSPVTDDRQPPAAAGHPRNRVDRTDPRPAVYVVPNGVDLRLYNPVAPAPTDLPRPIFGYVGALNYRLDYALLARVANRFRRGTLILVGGADHKTLADPTFQRLIACPNVRLLGHRPPASLASLIAQLDVCLIPFVDDPWFVRAAQPLKTFEYLACGKPVVSTRLPNLQPWSDTIALCSDADAFLAACAEASAVAPDPAAVDRRLAAAAANSWDARFGEVAAALRAFPGATAC